MGNGMCIRLYVGIWVQERVLGGVFKYQGH